MWNLTLYSKTECPLCDDAKRAIAEFSKECPLNLEIVDITQDKIFWEKYCYEIPVLLLAGQEIARHHISLKKLRILRQRQSKE